VRSLTVRAINLISNSRPQQLNLFAGLDNRIRQEQVDITVEAIRSRFGKKAIQNANLLGDLKMPGHGMEELILPGMMYKGDVRGAIASMRSPLLYVANISLHYLLVVTVMTLKPTALRSFTIGL